MLDENYIHCNLETGSVTMCIHDVFYPMMGLGTLCKRMEPNTAFLPETLEKKVRDFGKKHDLKIVFHRSKVDKKEE